jgi:sugar lactone lactonase YvrE
MTSLLAAGALAGAAVVLPATSAGAAPADPFPEVIALPDGFSPEGISTGRGTDFYVGSRTDGSIYRGDLRTGAGALLVEGTPGGAAIGTEVDRQGRLWVAGGATGDVFVYDQNGDELAVYDFAASDTFVNDVVVTRDAAWFTDSRKAVLYRIPIERDGSLGDGEIVPLFGDYRHGPGNNLNGIDASRDGSVLVAVQSNFGNLYNINPETGETTLIDLGGATVVNGDGIYLEDHTLYVVQNRFNKVAVIDVGRSLTWGSIEDELTSENFDVPTTMTRYAGTFYLVNARFGTSGPEPAQYWITAVERP